MRLAGELIEAERITEDTLILDSTVCKRYGREEGARKGYNPKKPGRPSHHPLKAGLGNGYGVNLWNRRGTTHSACQGIAFCEPTRQGLLGRLRIGWMPADRGWGEEGFLEPLEGKGGWDIGVLGMTVRVQKAMGRVGNWRQGDRPLAVAAATVALSPWKRTRRLIVIRQHVPTASEGRGQTTIAVQGVGGPSRVSLL